MVLNPEHNKKHTFVVFSVIDKKSTIEVRFSCVSQAITQRNCTRVVLFSKKNDTMFLLCSALRNIKKSYLS